MAEDKAVIETTDTGAEESRTRIYEIGYHIIPTVDETNVEKIVTGIRSLIEGKGGSFIAEGAPSLMRLAYDMEVHEGGKNTMHDRGYFGWIKFEAAPEAAESLDAALRANRDILRSMVFRTVREDTRARIKAPTLREVKRTDTIAPKKRAPEEAAAPVSEADLDKALSDLTNE